MNKGIALILVAFGGAASAQPGPAGTVSNVNGFVTVTQGANTFSAVPGTTLQNGSTVLSTSGSSFGLQMNSSTGGTCTVNGGANQAFTANTSQTCQQMQASVRNVTQPAAGGGGGTGAIIGAVVVPTAVAFRQFRQKVSGD